MVPTLSDLHVSDGPVPEDRRRHVERALAILPNQAAQHSEAALRFGLPMSGTEIHDRVRRTLPPRWRLSSSGAVTGGLIFSGLSVMFFTWLLPMASAALAACRGEAACQDPKTAFVLALLSGILSAVIGVAVLGGNLQTVARTSAWTDPQGYSAPIPDAALAAYGEALESGLFKQFWIVQASYEQPRALPRRLDPWLVGSLHRDAGAMSQDIRRAYVVLAYWE